MERLVVLVTGSRDWQCREAIERVFDRLDADDVCLVHGAARGADTLCEQVAQARGWKIVPMPADWAKDGKAAGPIRNQHMLDVALDIRDDWQAGLVTFAFKAELSPGLKRGGTEDMIRRLKEAGIPGTLVRR